MPSGSDRRASSQEELGLAAAGAAFWLVISVVLAVWSASAGVYHLDRAIRYSFGLPHQRYVEARGRALGGAFAVVVVLGASALGGAVVGAHTSALVLALAGFPLGLLALTLGIAGLYRLSVGPTVGLRQLLPGAAAAAVAVVVALVAFAVYVGLSRRFTAVYGAFARRCGRHAGPVLRRVRGPAGGGLRCPSSRV